MDSESCFVNLHVTEWIQNINRYSTIDMEGQHIIVNARCEAEDRVVLNNGTKLSDLNFNIQIFDVDPESNNERKSVRTGFGLISFNDEKLARADIPFSQGFVSGWFWLKPPDFAALWGQVLLSNYTDYKSRSRLVRSDLSA
jgi:hypothetical protein